MGHPANYTLHLQQGASLKLEVTYTDKETGDPAVDLTGYAGKLQVRRSMAVDEAPRLELTSVDSEITFDPVTGKITASFPKTKIDAIETNNQKIEDWVWGLQIYDPGDEDNTTRMILTGEVHVFPSPVRS